MKPTARAKLETYTDPANHYSFRTYDRQSEVDAPLTAADVLSANLLSLKLGWRDAIPMFADGDGPEQRLRVALDAALEELRDAKAFESYESVEALEQAVVSLSAANAATEGVNNWTPVTVSKVLHRRRPQIVPLNDSIVRKFYDVTMEQSATLRASLWHDVRDNEDWLGPLASTTTTSDGRQLSLLRLADILIWMDGMSRN
ncbi:hypothetical protein SAMN05660473_01281 [Arthrobacter sp. 49Tsu3.1M3]|uniref:DUF6308 family protein n=1 Tax=Arthrobacter sp. 49Tsu3.1M3 TaxID=1279029 RepID=UPI0009C7C0FE|nr:DUF6308 family protein [Arthrobacter sp. 49Tsu3.1M3]SKB54597.1 hypothetical protein SAMN05660473_01281 [Arthrobacter sp. 49Tsu3.1M3]